MSILRLIGSSSRTENKARRGACGPRRSLRFESLERRELLAAATAGDFATLKQLAESGQDYEIELTANITVGATDTINITSASGTVSILGAGHSITAAANRTDSLFNVSGSSLSVSGLTVSGLSYSGARSAVFYQTGGTITIDSGTFSSNTTTGLGGVLCVAGSQASATINGGTFNSNTARYGGVVHASNGGTVTIAGGTFSRNSATDGGGAIFTQNANVTVSSGIISGNRSGRGGAVYVNSGGFTVTGGTFQSNTANVYGGVIYTNSAGVQVTVTGGTFDSNTTSGSGGVVYAFNRNNVISISNAIIRNNEAKNGAVVFFEAAGTLSLSGVTAQLNKAAEFGGVAYTRVGTVTVTGGNFTGNSAVSGGVFYATNGGTLTVNSGTFGGTNATDGNSADNGGVFYLHGTTANIAGGTFSGNTASTSGGVCYATNHDEDDSSDGDVTVNLTGGTFSGNSALYGGALYLNYDASASSYRAALNLGAVTMENNRAVNGGAIANHGGTIADASAAVKTFTGNSGKYNVGTDDEPVFIGNGGAIFNNGTVTLSNAVFSGNYCVGNGGAVNNLEAGTVTLTGAKFESNSALGESVSVGDVDWAALASNTGCGGALQNWGTAALINACFTDNSAHDGGAIANGAGANLTLSQTAASSDSAPLGFAGNGAVYGGAIINVGTLTRTASQQAVLEFTQNRSYNNGGAISNSDNGGAVTAGSLNLYGLSFTGNTAGSPADRHAGSGGAVISAKPLTITGSTFTGNSASVGGKGGAIDQVAGSLTLTGDTFTDNNASDTGFGGAVNTWVGGTITDCAFTDNSAKNGGAVSVLGNRAVTSITHTGNSSTSFSGNSAVFGGAVYASGTVQIDGAQISDNTASLGGGVFAITTNISSSQKGRGKITFTGDATTFSGNTATRVVRGQNVGNDICASSSNNAEGNGAVVEIATLPTFSGSPGCDIGLDRSILVLASGVTIDPSTTSIYCSKQTTCGYTYNGSTLTFTSLSSESGLNKWRIYWSGSDTGACTEYTAGGAELPSGAVSSGAAVLIKGYIGASETVINYLIPTVSGSGACEALFDDALLDDAEVFEGLVPRGTALDQYCDECFL